MTWIILVAVLFLALILVAIYWLPPEKPCCDCKEKCGEDCPCKGDCMPSCRLCFKTPPPMYPIR